MSITTTNLTDLSYELEVTPGITPATPSFQLLPTTGGSPQGNTETEVSEVIRSDRQIDELIVVDENINAEVNFELSYTPYKPMLAALMRNTLVTVAVAEADISINSGTKTITTIGGNFITDGVTAGSFIKIAGFVNPANNGIHKVASVTTFTIVLDTDAVLVTEAGPLAITVDTEFYSNGVLSPADSGAFSFLKRVFGLADTTYFYYRGLQVSQMQFNFETGSILKGVMSLVGLSEEITETEIAGSTYAAVPAYRLLNATSSVVRIKLGGISGANSFSSLDLTVNNNIEPAKAIGTLGAIDLGIFTFEVTGEMSLYFEDKALYDFYKASNSFSLDILLEDTDGNAIGFNLPRCKFEALSTPIEGKDAFFMATGTIRALADPVSGYTMGVSLLAA